MGEARRQDTSWRDRAACRDSDPDLFFPTATRGPAYDAQVAAEKAMCAGCPVRATCLAVALDGLPLGIAGGLTDTERRALRPRSAPAPSVQAGAAEAAWSASPSRELGLALLAARRPRAEVARRCRVTVRTVERWAAQARADVTSDGDTADPGPDPTAEPVPVLRSEVTAVTS